MSIAVAFAMLVFDRHHGAIRMKFNNISLTHQAMLLGPSIQRPLDTHPGTDINFR